jgi:hypothetical protein
MARLHLDQHVREHGFARAAPAAQQSSPADYAVRRCAEAVLIFERMGNAAGAVRARCLLARCLLAAGHLVEAERVVHTAEKGLTALERVVKDPALAPLVARVRRASGELLLSRGQVSEGRRRLLEASSTFAQHHDWVAESETLRRLHALGPSDAPR